MSKFLEIPSCAKTPMCLHKEAVNYILNDFQLEILTQTIQPSEYRNFKGKEKELIQLLIDRSNGKLRMYGSAEDLLENINIFKSFPEQHKCFASSDEPYQTRPAIYKSLKNENYIAKSDVFVILQNMVLTLYFETFGQECSIELVHLFAFYLRSRQESMEKSVECVKFDEKIFEEMKNKLTEKTSQFSLAKQQQLIREFSNLNKSQIVEKFKRLIPFTMHLNQHTRLDVLLGHFVNFSVLNNCYGGIAINYSFASTIVKYLGTVIDENLEMFSPRRKDSKQPITVRVFEDGDQRFVMEEEFKKSIHEEYDTMNNTTIKNTISMENVLSKYKQKIANVEFIRYPITRTKHRVTPIQGLSGNIYIPAVDAFFQIMSQGIHGGKIYQRLQPDYLPYFLKDFEEFSESFYETESPYFIQNDKHVTFPISFIVNKSAKEVRNAKKDGFTVENLKNELAHLGLTTTFPEIQDYAEVVYSEIDKHKKESVLRTCDLFEAVEQCQLISILERLPRFKKFVHNQKGCHRVYGLKCEECAAENAKTQEDQKRSILEKELADLKIAHQKMLEENQQKSAEIQELEQKNLRLSVKNETNEIKMKQLTEKLAQSKLSIGEGNYSTTSASNASPQKILCLICEKSIESGEDQVIRCPLCKRRFHSKCAITWLKEHQQCPACNGELPKQ